MPTIVVLSGPVGAGKSAFAEALKKRGSVHSVSTRRFLIARTGAPEERAALQEAGDALDRETSGAWVADAAAEAMEANPGSEFLLIDSARIPGQVERLRDRFGRVRVLHVHLTAPDEVLEQRYLARHKEVQEFETYAEVKLSKTESQIERLAAIADVQLDTTSGGPVHLAARALTGRFPTVPDQKRLVDVIIGGQYGSEGKGNICAYIARDYDVLVRVGGPNAGHKVAEPPYKFIQLPSGTGANKEAQILIAAGSTIWLPQMMLEILDHPHLGPGRLIIDKQAMIIDDEDRRIEAAALESISSTKQGVGSASARKIMNRGDKPGFGPPVRLAKDVPELKRYVGDTKAELDKAYAAGHRVLVEGTQGTGLSIHHGTYPHVTSRETSAAGCLADAGIAPTRVRKVIMVMRTYPIRVGGDSGPMGVEIDWETVSDRSGISLETLLDTEKGTVSGRKRRVAEFDLEQVRRSAALNGATEIALTFADYLSASNASARAYDELDPKTRSFIEEVEQATGISVTLVSSGFGPAHMTDRR
ncbi:adenylosuccinate synthase [Microvirga sp. KLBC 81]|uniref:adenylosuccinate synthetase n=1 Tax=Microvirga sp. KLBC 81 TaxID=1862707 RepID=UPI000D515F5F|nr:adenylosuccinate synthetase [Microvirga sp. KLBC 81]PVE22717.1 adenylosuccinate synthase [Microvirga sp. KLBC 81]